MADKTSTPQPRHPLTPLSVEEIESMRGVLESEGLMTEATRVSYVTLREPEKQAVLDWSPKDRLPREVSLLLTDLSTLTLTDLVVDLDQRSIVERRDVDAVAEGTAPSFDEDLAGADPIVKSDQRWVDAIAKRGVTDLDKVIVVGLSAGVFGYEDEVGVRVVRALAFRQDYPTDSVWAHPIDGVVAHVDLTNKKVLRVIETEVMDVPEESGDYLDPAVRGEYRTSLKPISITQPEGVSFSLEDGVLAWENWKVRVGFNGREGLTLHQLSFRDQGEDRPILYRGSIAEMVVNYGDPTPSHAWQNYFDVGEYQFGRLANALELGCDCKGEITYVDAVVVDDLGQPQTLKNAICIHEEDFGVLWKHSDDFSGTREVRRQRRLVISFFVTVGNYDYGFYWYLYLDGKIELESKATGIVFTSGMPSADYPYATHIAPGLGAPVHQHLFCARLDMSVDGTRNSVDEIDAARVPSSAENPWGNAFTRDITRLTSEQRAVRDAKGSVGRVWRVSSAERTNRMGAPTSYVLHPEESPTLLAAEDSSIRRRAAFAGHHLWVTQYDRDERFPAGDQVNLNPGSGGLPAFITQDRSLEGEDVVLWHTFGLTHFPRTEDWPIMPVDYAGFKLTPDGFFDRNPTLDVPPETPGHCATGSGTAADGSAEAGGCSCH
ncbi:primary-amine oxidase [Nesterenkonia halotolerans]|uniref:Amine oxidase n=1 Tax=Nesterenkonia halotolerans TaxID=225325 RepID=A0ABR9J3Q8_9MICC|nr:primary-amine oxidase [Nesterenkonia halotolerans]MBE1513631.1 primary-amine oxidase [Nesterenkonia halotolerans]